MWDTVTLKVVGKCSQAFTEIQKNIEIKNFLTKSSVIMIIIGNNNNDVDILPYFHMAYKLITNFAIKQAV